ncbi:hypothetical protein AVEN_124254-1 [Araneus ventricosus]|uniref:Uncharacterized protein n=1 Tax=Araneus ventricosus TaxID=182803 RepID=A0A4Y1ZU63_ARAVE|nr:hypothetical protein AVEN_124254-1 [Araneus ventricosus]
MHVLLSSTGLFTSHTAIIVPPRKPINYFTNTETSHPRTGGGFFFFFTLRTAPLLRSCDLFSQFRWLPVEKSDQPTPPHGTHRAPHQKAVPRTTLFRKHYYNNQSNY